MRTIVRTLTPTLLGLTLVFGVFACSKKEPAEKTAAAPEAPLTTGYESAIKTQAIFRPAGTAPAVYGPGDLYNLLATGAETGNAFFQFEAVVPKGGGPPAHVHRKEDESFYVVSGRLEILLGTSIHDAKAGDFVFIPRGTVHRFKNVGSETAVQLVTFVPAGMDQFFQEVFPAVKDRNAAPPPVTDELIQKMNKAASKYGIEFPVVREEK